MPAPLTDNVAGHRLKYDNLMAHYSPEEAVTHFVGGSDPLLTGYAELEAIRRFKAIEGASVVDLGCGIGRLTRHLVHEDIASYLGIDIIPEIMKEAEAFATHDDRFRFEIGKECKIPLPGKSVDIVVAFSVITHLIDEEVFEYFVESQRVLKSGGVAIFSFFDMMYEHHRETFFKHAPNHRGGHGDLLKFTTKEILKVFADKAGFSSVEFIDGLAPIFVSGVTSTLMPEEILPQSITLGQSACIMHLA